MPRNFSFTIYTIRDRRGPTGQFKAMYKRGWHDTWHIYRQGGKDRFFSDWQAAYAFLLAKCDGNVAVLTLCFAGKLRPGARKDSIMEDNQKVDLEVKKVDGMYRLRDKVTGLYLYASPESVAWEPGTVIHYKDTYTAARKRRRFTGGTIVQLRKAQIELKP